MTEHKIKQFTIYQVTAKYEEKYRRELSEKLIHDFGQGPYSDHELVRKAISFSYTYFCDRFVELCQKETSVRFYQFALSQHEHAIEIALFVKPDEFPDGIDKKYIAIYRRILKWVLEQACDLKLHNDEKHDEIFQARALETLNELVFLGKMIFGCANIYAEQDMIEDVAEIIFDDENLYVIKHKHHYDAIIQEIQKSYGAHSFKHVVDKEGLNDLKKIMETCFGIKYEFLTTVLYEIHTINTEKGGQYCGFGWESLPLSVNSMFSADAEQARIIYKGLTLDRNNKLKLHDLVCKPNTMFRYLYRPILIWNIEGEDFAIATKNSFSESIMQLTTNCIPWGKAPDEWMKNECFKKYVHRKEDEHDKWLDDEVENQVKKQALMFHRTVTSIKTETGNLSLLQKDVGEVDFIIIVPSQKTVFVVDCKHLQGRYDMINQKNDFTNFVKHKGYNNQINNKVTFVKDNLVHFDFHNKTVYGQTTEDITKYKVEGIFIINTPTFYMFNSDFRIYTVDVFLEIITGKLVDPEITVVIDDDKATKFLKITYPYFKKPDYKVIDFLGVDE